MFTQSMSWSLEIEQSLEKECDEFEINDECTGAADPKYCKPFTNAKNGRDSLVAVDESNVNSNNNAIIHNNQIVDICMLKAKSIQKQMILSKIDEADHLYEGGYQPDSHVKRLRLARPYVYTSKVNKQLSSDKILYVMGMDKNVKNTCRVSPKLELGTNPSSGSDK